MKESLEMKKKSRSGSFQKANKNKGNFMNKAKLQYDSDINLYDVFC